MTALTLRRAFKVEVLLLVTMAVCLTGAAITHWMIFDVVGMTSMVAAFLGLFVLPVLVIVRAVAVHGQRAAGRAEQARAEAAFYAGAQPTVRDLRRTHEGMW